MSAPELTVNVTEFKAKCLGILDRLGRGELARVTITRRGKPIAVAGPAASATSAGTESFDLEAWRRDLRSYDMSFVDEYDWNQPILEQVERKLDEAESAMREAVAKDVAA